MEEPALLMIVKRLLLIGYGIYRSMKNLFKSDRCQEIYLFDIRISFCYRTSLIATSIEEPVKVNSNFLSSSWNSPGWA